MSDEKTTPPPFFPTQRCVFIHDPRVKGPEEASLLVSHGGGKGGVTSAASASAAANACPPSDASFFFPDLVRDIDSTEVEKNRAALYIYSI